jgi:hypothetical protein
MISGNYAFLKEPLNLPSFDFRIKEDQEGKLSIFDSLRKKYLILTPEEWVRQHIIHLLIRKDYPKSLFALERGVKYNQMNKRFDVLVLDRRGLPFFLIECKGPEISLTQKTVEQVCVYNKTLKAPFMGISNGKQHIFMEFDSDSYKFTQIATFPIYQ